MTDWALRFCGPGLVRGPFCDVLFQLGHAFERHQPAERKLRLFNDRLPNLALARLVASDLTAYPKHSSLNP